MYIKSKELLPSSNPKYSNRIRDDRAHMGIEMLCEVLKKAGHLKHYKENETSFNSPLDKNPSLPIQSVLYLHSL